MNIKRYDPCNHRSCDDGMAERPTGHYVRYTDYAAVEAKLGRLLRAERDWVLVEPAEYERLQTDLKRLQDQSDFYKSKLMDKTAYKTNIQTLDQVKHLEAKVDELKEEVTYQKQKAQEMVEFICECVAKGEFKAFKNGSVKFGKTGKPKDNYNGNIKGLDF